MLKANRERHHRAAIEAMRSKCEAEKLKIDHQCRIDLDALRERQQKLWEMAEQEQGRKLVFRPGRPWYERFMEWVTGC